LFNNTFAEQMVTLKHTLLGHVHCPLLTLEDKPLTHYYSSTRYKECISYSSNRPNVYTCITEGGLRYTNNNKRLGVTSGRSMCLVKHVNAKH
jgi:hypothetical protein